MAKRSPKVVTPENALTIIQSDDTVVLGTGCAEPQTLVEELVRQHDRLHGVRLLTMLPAGKCDYAKPEMEGHFRAVALISSGNLSAAMKAGRADHIPCHMSEVSRLFTTGYLKPNVALVQVSPPDDRGLCSLGISIDYMKAAVETAKTVIAEVNERMPRTRGDSCVHLSDLDFIVESARPLLTIKTSSQLSAVELAIGSYVAALVPDGATIEAGLGSIPDAVLSALQGKKDLRIHTGIISDGIIALLRSGALAPVGAGKAPVTAALSMGSLALYEVMHDNPAIEMFPYSYTHDIRTLLQIPGLICVNAAVEIDLMGQVNAECVSGVQISGVGGQLDFIRGAAASSGGKSIIVLPSTASGGTISRIVARLGGDAVVTTPRSDMQYVVTEYGVADLRGKSLAERARALAALAHPDFRDHLLKAGDA